MIENNTRNREDPSQLVKIFIYKIFEMELHFFVIIMYFFFVDLFYHLNKKLIFVKS